MVVGSENGSGQTKTEFDRKQKKKLGIFGQKWRLTWLDQASHN